MNIIPKDPRRKNFPHVPKRFWRRFDEHWAVPLQELSEVISLAESFGANPDKAYLNAMEPELGYALRSLHARTVRHACAVITLLSSGLGEQAIAQWRTCHELATIASFISEHPETAHYYLEHSVIEKHRLAKEIPRNSSEAPTEEELKELADLAAMKESEIKQVHKFGEKTRITGYSWSGYHTFLDIEQAVYEDYEWKPRAHYRLASQHVHASSNAVDPIPDGDGNEVLPVGPVSGGLTDAADLTCLSLMQATVALVLLANGSATEEDLGKLDDLLKRSKVVGALFWLTDPDILCAQCEGFVEGAEPPKAIPREERPPPCRCQEQVATLNSGGFASAE